MPQHELNLFYAVDVFHFLMYADVKCSCIALFVYYCLLVRFCKVFTVFSKVLPSWLAYFSGMQSDGC